MKGHIIRDMFQVKNKTIIGLKCIINRIKNYSKVKNKTIIGLKYNNHSPKMCPQG